MLTLAVSRVADVRHEWCVCPGQPATRSVDDDWLYNWDVTMIDVVGVVLFSEVDVLVSRLTRFT